MFSAYLAARILTAYSSPLDNRTFSADPTYAREFGIRYHGLPEGADASFFLCKELIGGYLAGVTGEYAPPEGYYCAEQEPAEFEAFDALFPAKKKEKLPGQLFE